MADSKFKSVYKGMSVISLKAKISKIASWIIIKLPKDTSAKLPSRGMVMIKGTLNSLPFQTPLEPDGQGSHWFKVDDKMQKIVKVRVGDVVTLAIEPIKDWPEPKVPIDLKKALAADPQAQELWADITPNARWDWIRWINATKNPQTRKVRIEKTFGKLKAGKRTACCFNRSQCTDMAVSKNGILIEPDTKD